MSPQYGELRLLVLTAEIDSGAWGTPTNFNGFRVLAALLHGTLVVGVSHFAALNRGRHLYSTGRPSRWALAYILVLRSDHSVELRRQIRDVKLHLKFSYKYKRRW